MELPYMCATELLLASGERTDERFYELCEHFERQYHIPLEMCATLREQAWKSISHRIY